MTVKNFKILFFESPITSRTFFMDVLVHVDEPFGYLLNQPFCLLLFD